VAATLIVAQRQHTGIAAGNVTVHDIGVAGDSKGALSDYSGAFGQGPPEPLLARPHTAPHLPKNQQAERGGPRRAVCWKDSGAALRSC
jgi:hypothetical protein